MAKLAVQPEVNIGLVGHVDHGKTTLTQALSGKWTDTHSEELKRGITIRLGYADATFYHDDKNDEYSASPTTASGNTATPVRKISLVDAPGHESLMATMLAGATIMDGALLLVSASEECPQPQTREHLMALEMSGIKNIVVVQNKIDLVTQEDALKNYNQIKKFLKGTSFENAPIVPISARFNVNISYLIKAIQDTIQTPERDESHNPYLVIARSFDVNKPGTKPLDLTGGILGGAVLQGVFKIGDEIELRPGRVFQEKNKIATAPYTSKITGLMSGGKPVKEVHPGGSVALMTSLDPSIIKSDKVVGCIVGKPGTLPPVWNALELDVHLLERMVASAGETKVDPLRQHETIMLNVNSAATVGVITKLSKKSVTFTLRLPVCAKVGDRVTLSRRVENRFRLIGYGIIKK